MIKMVHLSAKNFNFGRADYINPLANETELQQLNRKVELFILLFARSMCVCVFWGVTLLSSLSGSALRVFLFQHKMLYESIPHYKVVKKFN
jgi:hypothetical protein